jgi:hypothetical protein
LKLDVTVRDNLKNLSANPFGLITSWNNISKKSETLAKQLVIMVGMAPHVPRSRDPTLASSPQLSSETGAAGGTNAMATRSGEKEKIKPLVVLAAAIAAIGGELLHHYSRAVLAFDLLFVCGRAAALCRAHCSQLHASPPASR